jgi:hypothetical protein
MTSGSCATFCSSAQASTGYSRSTARSGSDSILSPICRAFCLSPRASTWRRDHGQAVAVLIRRHPLLALVVREEPEGSFPRSHYCLQGGEMTTVAGRTIGCTRQLRARRLCVGRTTHPPACWASADPPPIAAAQLLHTPRFPSPSDEEEPELLAPEAPHRLSSGSADPAVRVS